MSFQAMTWAVRQTVGNATGKAILLMLANYADENGSCFPSHEKLAEACECSPKTVGRWIADFEAANILSREKRYGEGGYRRSDRLYLDITRDHQILPDRKLQDRKLPNSEEKLTRQKVRADTDTIPS